MSPASAARPGRVAVPSAADATTAAPSTTIDAATMTRVLPRPRTRFGMSASFIAISFLSGWPALLHREHQPEDCEGCCDSCGGTESCVPPIESLVADLD